MRKYSESILDQFGRAQPGASVLVRHADTQEVATIYLDSAGSQVAPNPLTTDIAGRFGFYAANGLYDLTISGQNITPYTATDIAIFDNGTIDKAALGLEFVDNTRDIEKPISNDVAAALNLRATWAAVQIELAKKQDIVTGGGGTTTPTPTNPTPTNPTPGTPNPNQPYGSIIHYHGDSTVYGAPSGFDGEGQVAKPPPVWFKETLPSLPIYTVSNQAKSGSTISDLLRGTAPYVEPWTTVMSSRSDATIIILNHGINDTYEGRTVNEYKADLTEVITIARQYNKFVILQTPNPTDDNSVDARRTAMKEVAATMACPVIDVDAYMRNYATTNNINHYTLYPDGYHPSEAAYELIGKYAATQFLAIITPITSEPPPTPVDNTSQPKPFGRPAAEFGRLTFRDEFDGSVLNPQAWNEAIWYQSSHSVKNFAVQGGSLHIWPQAPFVNRTIDTDGKFYQKFGYIEADMKLCHGKGVWPAFWLYAHPNDDRPELDIMEAYPGNEPVGQGGWNEVATGLRPTNYGVTIHKANADYSYHEVPYAETMTEHLPSIDLSADFHKYGMKWTANEVRFYFDGVQLGPTFVSDAYHRKMMYILFDLWFGSASGQPDSTTPQGIANSFEIKYCRAWALADGSTEVSTNLPTPV